MIVIMPAYVRAAVEEYCGDGVDNDGSGGDAACAGNDADRDGFYTDNSNGLGTDCDDTNRKIYPGTFSTSGCAANTAKTCQSNGTFTACSSDPYCPSECTGGCRYIDFVNGNDANNGTTLASKWKTWLNFVTYFSSSPPATYEAPAANRCYFFFNGTYTTRYTSESESKAFFWRSVNVNGLQVRAYPGQTSVVWNPSCTSGNPCDTVDIIFHGGSLLFEGIRVTGGYGWGLNFQFPSGSGAIEARNMQIDGNRGCEDDNPGGFHIHTCTACNLHHNLLFNNYGADCVSGGVVQNNVCGGILFRGCNNKINDNVMFCPDKLSGNVLKYKHAAGDATCGVEIKRNVIYNSYQSCIELAQTGTVQNNLLAECDSYGIHVGNRGGATNHRPALTISNNTVIGGRSVYYMPDRRYDTAGNSCSSCASTGAVLIEKNIFQDTRTGYSGPEDSHIAFCPRGSDEYYTHIVSGGKITLRNNDYWNTSSGNPFRSQFWDSTASASFLCAQNDADPATSFGNGYSSFSAHTAAGWDSGSLNVNPALSTNDKAATTTGTTAWGWRTNATTSSTTTTSTTSSSTTSTSTTSTTTSLAAGHELKGHRNKPKFRWRGVGWDEDLETEMMVEAS